MFKLLLSAAAALVLGLYLAQNTDVFSYFFKKSEKLFTAEQLNKFDGTQQHPELYLAIMGIVYNVTEGLKHYGPGETYHGFVGRDASRSFVTGEFATEGAHDDLAGLNRKELLQLKHWITFYRKQYPKIGKLIGRYYDESGKPTQCNKEIRKLIKTAEQQKESERLEEIRFPPCNVEWDVQKGTRVWCTKRSGGIVRNWAGVPRKLYEPGSESDRCACISEENLNIASIREYDNCNQDSSTCYVKVVI